MNVIPLPKNSGSEPAKESLPEAGKNPQLLSLFTQLEVSVEFTKEIELELEALLMLPYLINQLSNNPTYSLIVFHGQSSEV